VIALGRLVLALSFMIAVWIEPSESGFNARVLLTGYDLWAALLLLATWRNWWLDFRLAELAHLIDIAVFGLLVYLTEGYTSPFYPFFLFLMLSAAIRWSWRETSLTAVAVLLAFLTAGGVDMALDPQPLEGDRLLVRFTYLVVLSLLIIWYRINEMPETPGARGEGETPLEGPPIDAALRRVARRMKAGRVLFAWSQREEPWLYVTQLAGGEIASERHAPDQFGALFADPLERLPFLFDVRRRRGIAHSETDARRVRGIRQRIDADFAARFGLVEGIVIRVRAREFEGEMFALDITGLCAEDLRDAEALGEEISALLDDWSAVESSEEAALTRARLSLARDLHDGPVQALAGAAFRLEGLKSWIADGQDPVAEIDAMKGELADEQRNLRAFIAGLREGQDSSRRVDLGSGLPIVAEQLQRRWGVDCDVSEAEGGIEGPLWMEHELHRIIHEAAANAVRHGKATRLKVKLAPHPSGLELDIEDNGRGIARSRSGPARAGASPRSVSERVRSLGGSVALASNEDGTRLEIRLPLEKAA
jgi:signal transduction histidine kinase